MLKSEKLDITDWKGYCNSIKITDESLISFLKDTNYGTKDLASYQQYLIDTGKATSTFATITAKAKDITKSLGATLASMGAMWAISEIITLIVKGIDSAVHKAENAKEEISNLQLEYESGVSELESMNSELETTKQRISELESKNKLTLTEEAELANLKAQNTELERNIALQEEKNKTKAKKLLSTTKKDLDTLDKDFDHQLKDYEKSKSKEHAAQDNVDAYREQRDYHHIDITDDGAMLKGAEEELTELQEKSEKEKEKLLNKISDYENYAQSFIDVNGTNMDTWSKSDRESYNDIRDRINNAYHTLYSDADYNKLVIEPIFSMEGLEGVESKLLDYFANGGALDISRLQEIFGNDIITALQNACALKGIDFRTMLQTIYDNAMPAIDKIAPVKSSPNSASDAQNFNYAQNEENKEKQKYYDTLDNESKALIQSNIDKFSEDQTADEFKNLVERLQEEANINVNVDNESMITNLNGMKTNLSDLIDAYDDFTNPDLNTIDVSKVEQLNEAFGKVDGYDEFLKVITETPKDTKKVQKAFDELTTSYLDSSKLIKGLTVENKDYVASELEKMGIANAQEYVEDKLYNSVQSEEAAQASLKNVLSQVTNEKLKNELAGKNLEDITIEDANALYNEANAAGIDANALIGYIVQKQLASSTSLDTSESVANLQNLFNKLGITIEGLDAYSQAMSAVDWDSTKATNTAQYEAIKGTRNLSIQNAKKKMAELKKQPKIKKNSDTTNQNSTKNFQSSTKETKQSIDWISRKLEILQKKIDGTKAKFENLFAVKSKSNNLQKQINQTTKLLNANEKAANAYKKYAAKIDISDKLKIKVRNANYKITDYTSDTAEKINKYKDYYDKYKEAQKKTDELRTSKRELKEQKYQLYVDDAQLKIDRSNAHMELDSGDYKKQAKHLNAQKNYLKTSYDYQIKIANLSNNKIKASQLEAEYKQKLREIETQKFEDIKNQYENEISLLETQSNILNDQISLIEAKGMTVNANYYKDQIAYDQDKLQSYDKEKTALEKQLNSITTGTEEWYDAKSALDEIDSSIRSCNASIVEMNNSITELASNIHQKLLDSFNSVSEEADWIVDLMSNKDLFNEKTGITNEGLATLGSYAVGYNTSKAKANLDSNLISSLQAGLSHDFSQGVWEMLDSNKKERRYESLEQLQDAIKETYSDWRDQINETYEYENKIIDMMKDKLESELSALQELIDAKKDALQAEKDLYDYQKSIQKSTQNISSLEKQITALQGDTSQETLARIQKLQSELADAQDDLQEQEYDQYISDQEDMLDKLYQEYEDLITAEMKDTKKLLQDGINLVNGSLTTINKTIDNVATNYDYRFENIDKIYSNTDSINANVAMLLGAMQSSTNATENVNTDTTALPSQTSTTSPQTNTIPLAPDETNEIIGKIKKKKKKKKSGEKLQGVISSGLRKTSYNKGGIASRLNQVALENGDDGWVTLKRGEGILTPLQTDTFAHDFVPRMDTMIAASKQLSNLVPNLDFGKPAVSSNIEAHYEFNLENCENATDIIQQIQTNPTIRKAFQDVTINQINQSGTRLSVNRYK